MEPRWWRALAVVQGVASKGYWLLLLLLLLLLPPPQAAASGPPAESQGESPPVTPEEVPAVEVLGQEEYSYNTSSVQGDSPLLPDDADDFLPPIISTEAPLENPSPPGCSSPLGLTTGDVLDWQISASSSYPATWDAGCQVKYARLHQPNGRAWCAGRRAAGEWVLVDLGVPAKVTGLLTQGKGDDEEWVTSFELSYSLDAYHWHFARDIYNNKKVFQANVDSHQTRHNFVEPPVLGRFVRLHVLEWHTHPSMRFELLGCQECKMVISEGSDVVLTASSHKPWRRSKSCQPKDAALNSHRAWCARRKDEHQWLQWDLGPPHLVTGVVTRGRGDTGRNHWVKAYTLTYSNDSKVWFTYKDGNHLDTKVSDKVFGGNLDKHTERRHYLNSPFKARYVRLHPQRWRKSIALRAALIGCPHKGDCGEGFFRVTPDTSCVENIAYKGSTWVNDKRHSWSDWNYGPASLAVDGNQDTTLQSCAVIDNDSVDEPVWMVDLGKRQQVRGLVLLTWQGRGQDQQTLYRDYVFGLDRLTVFVENQRRLDTLSPQDHKKCASITRLNNALFRERVHVECPQPIKGRFLYIKASGVANRWHRVFSMVLCEVMAY
ncbi:lactadherin-like isoform X1 [Eriocheir sinensis]|uniref:lactadherin-like isoform X1 n=1 Tax=Eriocheir sinensis TaxID=95602 RepID=UPI0021C85FE3|nr:lactadherin-like isoform X1 [Eriocheir sinensis]